MPLSASDRAGLLYAELYDLTVPDWPGDLDDESSDMIWLARKP